MSYLKIISLIFSESLQWIKLKIAATLVNDKLKNSSSELILQGFVNGIENMCTFSPNCGASPLPLTIYFLS